MVRATASLALVVIAVWGCSTTPLPSPTGASLASPTVPALPSPTPFQPTMPPLPLESRSEAIAAAETLTSIGGPWRVGDVVEGRLGDVFQGSANDPDSVGASFRAENDPKTVWRVDLTGPNGSQELYVEASTGKLITYIIQGR
jgi:hypothetical protein